jgi:hypothetical protein
MIISSFALGQLKPNAEAKAVQDCTHQKPGDCAQRRPRMPKYENLILDLRLVVQNNIQQ